MAARRSSLRAIALSDFGAAPTLHDLPVPQTGAGEILVRVRASSVNGFDVAVVAGYLKGMMEHRFPVVLGKDFAGTVESVGPGASRFATGDPVFGVVMKPVLGDGTLNEGKQLSSSKPAPGRWKPHNTSSLSG